jgi:dihydrofolate synthase/folylpolyglutamate synthase
MGWKIPERAIIKGLEKTIKNTGLLGRWQELGHSPRVICDIAHNSDGIAETIQQLRSQEYDQLHLVLGFVRDKSLENILPLFPKEASYYFCSPKIERGLDVHELQMKAGQYGLTGGTYQSVRKAYNEARNSASIKDLVYIGGSAFVVAEVL